MKSTTPVAPVAPPPFFDRYRPHVRARTWFTGEIVDPKTGELVKLPSMTKQEFVDQCDINNILKQFKMTGMVTHISAKAAQGEYLDLPDDVDFQTSLNIVHQAEAAFATLPSKIRTRFENDPAQFLAFMADPKNMAEASQLGLLQKAAPAAPQEPQAGAPLPTPVPPPAGS